MDHTETDKFKIWGHPCFFDNELSQLIYFVVGGCIMSVVSLFGILGNILSALVLTKTVKAPLSVLLLGLSFCDCIVCLIEFMGMGLTIILKDYRAAEWYVRWVCLSSETYMDLLWVIGLTGSTYFTVAATFERFVAVCFPFKVSSIMTPKRMRYLSIAILSFSLAYQLIEFIIIRNTEYTSEEWDPTYHNFTCEYPQVTPKESVADIIRFWMFGIVMFCIPMTSVSVLNTIIIIKIHRQAKERKFLTRSQLKTIQLTKMLTTVVIIYLLCHLLRVIRFYMDILYIEVIVLSNFLLTFNSAINYLIYCAFGENFRQSFINLFIKCESRPKVRDIRVLSRKVSLTCYKIQK